MFIVQDFVRQSEILHNSFAYFILSLALQEEKSLSGFGMKEKAL